MQRVELLVADARRAACWRRRPRGSKPDDVEGRQQLGRRRRDVARGGVVDPGTARAARVDDQRARAARFLPVAGTLSSASADRPARRRRRSRAAPSGVAHSVAVAARLPGRAAGRRTAPARARRGASRPARSSRSGSGSASASAADSCPGRPTEPRTPQPASSSASTTSSAAARATGRGHTAHCRDGPRTGSADPQLDHHRLQRQQRRGVELHHLLAGREDRVDAADVLLRRWSGGRGRSTRSRTSSLTRSPAAPVCSAIASR